MDNKKKPIPKKNRLAKTDRTRGFYAFSRDFPEVNIENGLRQRQEAESRLSGRSRLKLAAVAVIIFIIAFLATSISLKLSQRQPPKGELAETLTVLATESSTQETTNSFSPPIVPSQAHTLPIEPPSD